ncbi:MAG TPA: PhzF family phenazine biosynthesis protein, partial [Gemmatimonadaceae bacterium]|nr:PhzF family phenazine biosynthesis protein [Gemmatimonadaceae bacterium]
MRSYEFVTLDVFTDTRFGGNQLAVFRDARGMSDSEMQSLAAEFNLSETTFVLPPDDSANTARVRIFNRRQEMQFAGHPSLGTGFTLAQEAQDRDGVVRLEVRAGLVEVRIDRDGSGVITGGTVQAPQPLTLGAGIPVLEVAACAGLEARDILTTAHAPVVASAGNPYIIAEVTDEALTRASPQLEKFRQALAAHPTFNDRYSVHLYALDETRVRARMFAPLAGTWEDPATGSANAPLAGL